MSVCLRVLVPDDTINYVQNPALRYDTTGWTAASATISRTLDYARFNIASLKVITSGILTREGAYYRVNALAGISDPLTASAYVRGAGRVHLRLIDNPTGKEWKSDTLILVSDRWQRIEVTGFSTGSNDMRLYVETDDKVQSVTFYVDGAQMERKAYATSYCDGDQPGCRWDTLIHSGTSSRTAYTRKGGRWVELAGPCRENDDIYATVIGGMGMAPISSPRQSYSQESGSFLQGYKIEPRVVSISFFVKHKNLISKGKPNLAPLHKLRQELVDIFKNDLTSEGQPVLFEYRSDAGEKPVYIWLTYEAGLEGEWDLRNQWVNSFPVRFVADIPLFFEDNQEVATLKFKRTLTQTAAGAKNTGALVRKNGLWSLLNAGYISTAYGGGSINEFAENSRGNIYMVGSINDGGGKNDVIYWDGSVWRGTGSGCGGMVGAYARCVCVDANDNVYVGGWFTTMNGVAANSIAKWNGASWSALGSGITGGSALVYRMLIGPNGHLYVIGSFTQAGGTARTNIAKWDGSSWQSVTVTAPVVIYSVSSMTMLEDNRSILIAGNGLAILDTATDTVTELSIDPNALTFSGAAKDKDGAVWLAGMRSPYAIGMIGNDAPARYSRSGLKYSSGGAYEGGAGGGDDTVCIVLDHAVAVSFRMVILQPRLGAFSPNVDQVWVPGFAYLDQWAWIPPDMIYRSESSVTVRYGDAMYLSRARDFYVGVQNGSGAANELAVDVADVTVVANKCTAPCWPIITVTGPGNLRWIENQATGHYLGFGLRVETNETVTIDFGKATMTSDLRGDVSFGLLSARGLRDFFLVPGDNPICVLMYKETSASSILLSWVSQHWSADAVARQEVL